LIVGVSIALAMGSVTLKGGNIELGMPGNFVVKAAKHSHVGAASLEAELPQFEVGETQRTSSSK
uniref:DUF2345 domain-containing protein n=1 Tax=Klebsiella aerogenes TaxID=548 RepID=UPI001953D1C8